MTARRRPSLAVALLSLMPLLLFAAEASPVWRARALFGDEERATAAAAAPAPSSPAPASTAAATPPPTTATLCAEDAPEDCGALVIQPPAAKAALKDYVDCVTDPAARGEACARKANGDGDGNGDDETDDAFSSAAKAESDPRNACPDDPLFEDSGEFSGVEWDAVAEKVRVWSFDERERERTRG